MNEKKLITIASASLLLGCGNLSAENNNSSLYNYESLGSGKDVRSKVMNDNNDTTLAMSKKTETKDGMEGKCGEGKCGEGKCGEEKSREGKCGESKCGEGKCGN